MINPDYFPIKRGLISGAKCPISGTEFVKFNATKAEYEVLIAECQAHTRAIMYAQDGDEPKHRDLVDRQNRYKASQQQ